MNPNQNNFYQQFMNNYRNSMKQKENNTNNNNNKSIEIIAESRFFTDNNFMSKTPTYSKNSNKLNQNNEIPLQMEINHQNNPHGNFIISFY
jgi:hypothetical protein